MAEFHQQNVNDVNKTDIANYSSTQPMDINKKYFTKKGSVAEDESMLNKKTKKCKLPSRNNYVSSAKPSISRKTNYLHLIERKSSVSNSRKK